MAQGALGASLVHAAAARRPAVPLLPHLAAVPQGGAAVEGRAAARAACKDRRVAELPKRALARLKGSREHRSHGTPFVRLAAHVLRVCESHSGDRLAERESGSERDVADDFPHKAFGRLLAASWMFTIELLSSIGP